MTSRLTSTFARLREENRAGFVAYVMAGDGDTEALLDALPGAGADVIELGMPFTDPMADGPAIQAAANRALESGMTVKGTLSLAKSFRSNHPDTPLVLMGYANPIHHYGWDAFARDASDAGVDGLICVDLPPEEDAPLRVALSQKGIAIIRLATPTTDDNRLKTVAQGSSGFVYYVSTTGVTGAGMGAATDVGAAVARVRKATGLPVVVGFGVRTEDAAAEIASASDAVVVGSAIVSANHDGGAQAAIDLVKRLSAATHGAERNG
ncbi:tryptophan synthase subunit alpha [Hyphobacterium marinum]|uniref:Tryptophan synthase alpha chain n=1 Tax=Hyphobacterium marinum TaxID=3116574 RepID=A0ABU7LUH6_9PROT|nr:tryptophan synthase subunit alpha [Hyphobacterium sp. Y6023]MEE2565211.1 tryptophan synthase subunit alpha [Hyphobacterium sp. Y6023]